MPIENRKIQVDKDPQKHTLQAHYSDKQKYNACVLYKIEGSLTSVSDQTGIPYETLRVWSHSDWWKETSQEISNQAKQQLSGKLKKIVDKSIIELQDRLENGDIFINQKTGEISRRPLGAYATNQIMKDAVDRTFVIEKLQREEKVHETQEKIQDRLLKLASEFQRFSKAHTIDGETTLNAIHDEREAGLQERIEMGTPAPGSGEAAGSP